MKWEAWNVFLIDIGKYSMTNWEQLKVILQKLYVDQSVQPKNFKSRTVPYVMKGVNEKEQVFLYVWLC